MRNDTQISHPPASAEPMAKDWKAIDTAIDAYLDGYELRGEPGDHTPTEFERFLILDAINGLLAEEEFLALLTAPPAADERDAKARQQRQPAGAIREPLNGAGWHVVWWNESMRMILPDGSRLDSFQAYGNCTMQLTIKAGAAMATQQSNGGEA